MSVNWSDYPLFYPKPLNFRRYVGQAPPLNFSMKDSARQTRTYLMELFSQHGFNPRTDLGQNFLIDINIIEYIVAQAELDENDVVLEIGAGTGGMTTFLAQEAAHVISVELDNRMYSLAWHQTKDLENVTLLNCDALKNKSTFSTEVLDEVQKQLDAEPGRRLKLVSNLPYNVATPIVTNLMASDIPWARMVVTIQLELGERMKARPGKPHYGALSIWLQSQAYVKLCKRLPPNVFWPRPKVNSAIMRLVPLVQKQKKIIDRPFFQDFNRRLFHQRRKLLRGVLMGMYRKQIEKTVIDEILLSLGMEKNTRAEELNPEIHVKLANAVWKAIQVSQLD